MDNLPVRLAHTISLLVPVYPLFSSLCLSVRFTIIRITHCYQNQKTIRIEENGQDELKERDRVNFNAWIEEKEEGGEVVVALPPRIIIPVAG